MPALALACRNWLRACGIDPALPWPQILAAVFLRRPPDLARIAERGRELFPHVDFRRLRPADPVRILLQTIWLALLRPPAARRDAAPASRLRSAWMRWRHGMAAVHARSSELLDAGGERIYRRGSSISQPGFWDLAAVRYAAYALAAVLALFCISTPFSTLAQATFVALLWSVAMLIRRIPGPVSTLFLIVLSVTASTRYLWWRVAFTLNWDVALDFIWGILLLAAEVYTWLILILGYFQTAWPLKRQPAPLPADLSAWPSVDIFIPTYNEPLKVVKPTVFAAQGIDWPAEKINIHLLDDGRRDEFRRFAEEAGIGYIVRPDNRHAKAGNLNHALTQTSGEYVAIFDCDHIPTRSFLQMTMGWFLRDGKLAMVQTPHHFFSPDPFERNLSLFRRVPNEGELFYGLIQDGNDLWNAAFFCGSCAVIKRGPLEEIGGIAVETVTEDAHTALKLQRRGYNTAYINIPQAAGLATESLSAHIGQRIRWARGMAQIFRLDNPYLGKGLSLAQRICYSNAMLHFLNGGPRLVFLTAPLAFLLFHAYVIYAPALAVALYVLPHMAHASLTNSRMQGGHRHSFWAEVYETVLAWYIFRPTTVALLDPRKGRFNVTAKGGLVETSYFDWGITWPYLFLVSANLLGFAFGIWHIFRGPADEIATTLLNLFWTGYNILLLGAALAVASETRQVRLSHRVRLDMPAVVRLADGRLFQARTWDFSEGGAALLWPGELPDLEKEAAVTVSLWRGQEEYPFTARVVGTGAGQLRLRWEIGDAEQERRLVQCTFARADAWVSWSDGRGRDRPLAGLKEVLAMGLMGYRRLGEYSLPLLAPLLRRHSLLLTWTGSLLPRWPASLQQSTT